MVKFTKVLVSGGWDYDDEEKVHTTLDKMAGHYGDLLLIHDNGAGVAALAAAWAGRRRVVQARVPGLWGVKTDPDRRLATAGLIALAPDICVVFTPDLRGVGFFVKMAKIPTYEV